MNANERESEAAQLTRQHARSPVENVRKGRGRSFTRVHSRPLASIRG